MPNTQEKESLADPVNFDHDALDDEINDFLSKDLQRLDSEADAILDSIRNEAIITPDPKKKVRKINVDSSDSDHDEDNTTNDFSKIDYPSDHRDDDHDDDHDAGEAEDEISQEMKRLNEVVRSIRQEVDAQSVESMTSALSNMDARYYKYSQRTLLAERTTDFIQKHKLYGPGVGGSERNTPLLVVTVAIWTVVLLLVLHVKYGAIGSDGQFQSMPEIVQKLVDRLF